MQVTRRSPWTLFELPKDISKGTIRIIDHEVFLEHFLVAIVDRRREQHGKIFPHQLVRCISKNPFHCRVGKDDLEILVDLQYRIGHRFRQGGIAAFDRFELFGDLQLLG